MTRGRLLGATTASEGVHVVRGGDGHSMASFTINFLSGGAVPLLHAVSSATHPLAKRTHTADFMSSSTSADVSLIVERPGGIPGGIELLPIPGRYLSAPTDRAALSLRLAGETTARCAAPNWEALHVGCFGTFNDNSTPSPPTFLGAMYHPPTTSDLVARGRNQWDLRIH